LSSVLEIRGSLAHSENDNAGGRTYGEADVRAYIADKRAEEPDDKTGGTGDPAVDLGAVADAMAGADQGTIDGWPRLICGGLPNSPLRMRTCGPQSTPAQLSSTQRFRSDSDIPCSRGWSYGRNLAPMSGTTGPRATL
jgi:hypothetical protein